LNEGSFKGIKGLQTQREDVVRNKEFELMIERVGDGEVYTGLYMPKASKRADVKPEVVMYPAKAVKCFLALLWLFGKRASENLLLKRSDIDWDDQYLTVRFRVKKRKEKEYVGGVRVTYVKRITIQNPYVKYVIDWVKDLPPDAYVFPGETTGGRVRKITRRWINKNGEIVEKQYVYKDDEAGHLSREKAWKIVKSLNPDAWLHLFRRSLATQLAEAGCTTSELMAWFDWKNANVAESYVSKGLRLTERISKRVW